ncbi:hypothetical protein HD599_001581 [Conyzicola lurida]|uniref:DUF3159 domain-containing protein n=1 Tax=Conyzicola lurida TaxID=1172621 RepID=A0A841ALN0_9MICO|nr:hypothetical protein [Conyzicola lurida]
MTDDRGDQPTPPTFSESLSAAAQKSGFGQVTPGETPTAGALLGAIGGVRGIVESLLPGFLFVVVYAITEETLPAVLVPAGIAVLFVIVRLITRTPVVPALVGLLGIAVSAALAIFTGDAKENFILGFFLNGGYVIALLISLAVRWPVIGIIVGLLRSEGAEWRTDKAKFRVATVATVLWTGMFAARLVVQVPLYLADQTQWLGATKLIMGLPLYAATLWVTWLLVRAVYAKTDAASSAPRKPAV